MTNKKKGSGSVKIKTIKHNDSCDKIKNNEPEERSSDIDGDLEEMNIHHKKDSGEFSSEKDSGCESSYFVDKKRKGKHGNAPDISLAGRGPTKDGRSSKYKCSTGEPKFESLWRQFLATEDDTPNDEQVDVPHDIYDAAKAMQKDKVLIRKLRKALSDADKGAKSDCPLSYDDALRIINSLDKAEKGKLYDDK
jgi:hypothetical protein